MSAEIIKEFLVGLGFKVDSGSEQRFHSAMRSAEAQGKLLADSIEKATKSFVTMLRDISVGMEELFYASDRTKASAENLKAFGYAASQLGGTVDSARSSVEAFAKFLRSNPGGYGVLENIGISTKTNGQLRDTVDILTDLGKLIAKQPYWSQLQYADMLGIDEKTLRAITSPEFDAGLKRYKEKLKQAGLDPQQAAKDSRDFQNLWRDAGEAVSIVFQKVESKMISEFGGGVKTFGDWIIENSDNISQAIVNIAKMLVDMGKAIVDIAGGPEKLGENLSGFSKDVRKASDSIAGLVQQLRELRDMWAKFDDWSRNSEFLKWLNDNTSIGQALNGTQQTDHIDRFNDSKSGGVSGWWKRNMPTWLGGNPEPASFNGPSGRGASTGDAARRGAGRDASAVYNDPNSFFDSIIKAEGTSAGGRNPYDTSLGYLQSPKPLSQMTMKEALEWGDQIRKNTAIGRATNSSAKGAFQIVNTTQRDAMRALGLKMDDMFNEENQQRMASWIARKQGLAAWEGFKNHPDQRSRAAAAMGRGEDRSFAKLKSLWDEAKPFLSIGGAQAADGPKTSPFGNLDAARARFGASPAGTSWTNTTNAPTLNQKVENHFHGQVDPATAQDFERRMGRTNADAIRNLQGPAQ